jgi:hypothetical protein
MKSFPAKVSAAFIILMAGCQTRFVSSRKSDNTAKFLAVKKGELRKNIEKKLGLKFASMVFADSTRRTDSYYFDENTRVALTFGTSLYLTPQPNDKLVDLPEYYQIKTRGRWRHRRFDGEPQSITDFPKMRVQTSQQ